MAITVNPYEFFDVTIGITLVGLAVTGSLFGVSTAQAGWYYKHYPRDRRFLKMLVRTLQPTPLSPRFTSAVQVALIWSFDTLHLFLYAATMWVYLVRKEVSTAGVTVLPWESSAQLLCNACAIFTVQTFYSYRIWTLSQNRFLAAFLTIFIVADFGLAITLFVKSIMTTNVEAFIGLTHFDIALSSVTASTDVLLSGTLMVLLANSRTGSVGANRLINKLSLRMQAERIGHISLPRLTSITHDTSKQATWDRSAQQQPRSPDVVVAMPHGRTGTGTGVALEGDKEAPVYRRPGTGFHEPRLLDVDSEPESASSLRAPSWERVPTFASCPAVLSLPEYLP
ncbi:hypothetical protein C8Q79DRAFT_1007788 [Trametes meyenii]|nr:hypothetical protein C8Q79DRAFT_1007788 [Trametes meyenii]